MKRQTEVRLVEIISFQKSSVMASRTAPPIDRPALLTSTSTRPQAATAASVARCRVGERAHVGADEAGAAALCRDRGLDRPARGLVELGDQHGGAGPRQRPRARLADAHAGAGDDRHAAVEFRHVSSPGASAARSAPRTIQHLPASATASRRPFSALPVHAKGAATPQASWTAMTVYEITPDYSVAPQIAAEDVAEIAARGFRSIMCNRPDGESPGQAPVAEIEARRGGTGSPSPSCR